MARTAAQQNAANKALYERAAKKRATNAYNEAKARGDTNPLQAATARAAKERAVTEQTYKKRATNDFNEAKARGDANPLKAATARSTARARARRAAAGMAKGGIVHKKAKTATSPAGTKTGYAKGGTVKKAAPMKHMMKGKMPMKMSKGGTVRKR